MEYLLLSQFGLLLLFAWFIMAIVGAVILEPHGRAGQGVAWGFFFGPVGLIAAVIIRANLDREKSDNATRELLRHALATREQEMTRAVVAALGGHLAKETEPPIAVGVAPPAHPPPPPVTPPPRSYEEI